MAKKPEIIVRQPFDSELDQVYLAGFDTWAGQKSREEYLIKLRTGAKYKQGTWWVAACDGKVASSMIVYKDAFGLPPETIGIGSVATPPAFRRNGYASQLIRDFLAMKPLEAVRAVFLFSEVKPEFYGKLGFVALPPELQKYPKSLCMVRCDPDYLDAIRSGLVEPPLYF